MYCQAMQAAQAHWQGGGGGGGGFKGVCWNPAEDFIPRLATHLVPYLFVRSPLSLAAIENLRYPNGETR